VMFRVRVFARCMFLRNRTNLFRVKHFGTIDLAKHTFAGRSEVRSGDLDLARCSARV